jgi:predicted PurR-regulated permease PerM
MWAALVFVGLVLAFGYPLVDGLTHLAHRLPLYVRDAASGHGWIGHLARRFHVEEWAARNAPRLESLGASLAKPALSFGKGAVSLLATLATITALVVLLLLEGPKMRRGVLGLMSPERGARYSRVAHEINQSVTGYVLGDLLTSLMAGVVVFITLAILRVPFPFLWALWVALVDFLPMIGGALAGIPTVLFAAGHSLTAGIITAAVFIGYQQLENHVLNPVVMSRTVKVNPLLGPGGRPDRLVDRWVARRLVRRFCRGAAFHSLCGRPAGHHQGTLAGQCDRWDTQQRARTGPTARWGRTSNTSCERELK